MRRIKRKNPRKLSMSELAALTKSERIAYYRELQRETRERARVRDIQMAERARNTPRPAANYAHPTKEWHRRKRGKNPRLQNMFVLLATRGKTVLKYVGGVRFSSKGRAVLFPSRAAATTVARDLRLRFPALRGYTLRVQS